MQIHRIGVVQLSRDDEIPVHLDENRHFVAEVGGVEVRAESFEELEKKARAQASRQKVQHQIRVVLAVPSDSAARNTLYVRAILRGRNDRTRAYLFTIDGKKEALEHPKIVALGDDVADEQLAGLNQLQCSADDATAAVVAACRPFAAGKDLTAWKLLEASERTLTVVEPQGAASQA